MTAVVFTTFAPSRRQGGVLHDGNRFDVDPVASALSGGVPLTEAQAPSAAPPETPAQVVPVPGGPGYEGRSIIEQRVPLPGEQEDEDDGGPPADDE